MSTQRQKQIYKATLAGSVVNILLVVFKFIAGILGKSSAMVADAVHSLSDLLSDFIVIAFIKISGKPVDENHDYGHGKYETLATIIVGIILGIAGIGLLADGVMQSIAFFRGHPLPRPGMLALWAAVISIVSKELLYHYTMRVDKKVDSPALRANAWHHRSDALTSIGTLIGIAGAMFLGERWRVLDPMAAVFVSCFIIKAAYSLSKPAFEELLEISLPAEQKEEIGKIIMTTPGVLMMHHLRTRRIGVNIAVECHIKLNPLLTLAEAHDIATDVENRLKAGFGNIGFINIHMEPYGDCSAMPDV